MTLLDFVYTHCTDACPLLSATFQQAQRKLADDKLLGSRVMLVSLSVDPQHDTPPVLAEYGQQFKADANGWKLLDRRLGPGVRRGHGLQSGHSSAAPRRRRARTRRHRADPHARASC